MTTVYLIHLEHRFNGHSQHYVGYTNDLERRLEEHRGKPGTKRKGAKLLHLANQAGIVWAVVRIWPDEGRKKELELKATHHLSRICPVCQGEIEFTSLTLRSVPERKEEG